MLVRELKRLVVIVGPLLILGYLGLRLYLDQSVLPSGVNDWIEHVFSPNDAYHQSTPLGYGQTSFPHSNDNESFTDILNDIDPSASHNEVYSVSTSDRKFFYMKFGEHQAMNPNIVPHPLMKDTWIIVAQQYKSPHDIDTWFSELVCSAAFKGDVLECIDPPTTLPIAATTGDDKCTGALDFFSLNIGPHDARVFYGPKVPYAVYGSNSIHTCFGQWIQDVRSLVPWGMDMVKEEKFRLGTELQRPPPYYPVEKNWFLFWDENEEAYVHYDVAPNRVFAKLADDGSVGPDLAANAAMNDERCMAKMRQDATKLESVHQATNSLAITLCKRSDLSCEQNASNTFIFTIFQHKTYHNFHSEYEPYVMLFNQQPPFEIYGLSRKPIWIHGREVTSEQRSQMFYVVSMSWKTRGQKYHGYLDDVVFVSFGIEDENAGGIDVLAGDLLRGIGLCSE
ncbi:hypothetical protein BJ170DRAFT_297743 [Xylariales sp. AK1849]|nr:hypothetical protein BJ170DRAFT_297743 [Xylariales sp. AK1849]